MNGIEAIYYSDILIDAVFGIVGTFIRIYNERDNEYLKWFLI